jgi:hypothetical protein
VLHTKYKSSTKAKTNRKKMTQYLRKTKGNKNKSSGGDSSDEQESKTSDSTRQQQQRKSASQWNDDSNSSSNTSRQDTSQIQHATVAVSHNDLSLPIQHPVDYNKNQTMSTRQCTEVFFEEWLTEDDIDLLRQNIPPDFYNYDIDTLF